MSTQRARQALAKYFARNPRALTDRFEGDTEYLELAQEPCNWRRRYRARAGHSNEEYQLYTQGTRINRGGDPQPLQLALAQDFAWERDFELVDTEGQVAHLVLEDHMGRMWIADYTGD